MVKCDPTKTEQMIQKWNLCLLGFWALCLYILRTEADQTSTFIYKAMALSKNTNTTSDDDSRTSEASVLWPQTQTRFLSDV